MLEIIPFEEKYALQAKELVFDIFKNEFPMYVKSESNFYERRLDLSTISATYQKDDKSNYWLALDGNKVVGSIALENKGYRRAFMKRFYIQKKYRDSGLSVMLFDTLISFATSKGYKSIFIGTEPIMQAANNFYHKNGFKQIKQLPQGLTDPYDTIFYKLKL